MYLALLVGLGGFLGSICRYLIARWLFIALGAPSFPYGTLAVNVLGCLVIGFLGGLADGRQVLGAQARGLLMVGFLGGFTTFSSFGYETLALVRQGEMTLALLNVLLQVTVCLAAVLAAYTLAKLL